MSTTSTRSTGTAVRLRCTQVLINERIRLDELMDESNELRENGGGHPGSWPPLHGQHVTGGGRGRSDQRVAPLR